jgi:hypothetical protein
MTQALALCDLVADPQSGIMGVTVVGASPSLVAALREAARETGMKSATWMEPPARPPALGRTPAS